MNLFKRFMELVPGADPLLVGTVTATSGTSTTLEALGGGARGRGGHRPEGLLPGGGDSGPCTGPTHL